MQYWIINAEDSRVQVCSFGGVVTSFTVGEVELFDGYQSEAEIRSRAGCRGALLAPWSNRIRNGRYTFAGKVHEIPEDKCAGPAALHGLYTGQEFVLVHHRDDGITLRAECGATAGYPWPGALEVEYVVRPGRLEVRLSYTNLSEDAAPVGLGWHPYFRPLAPTRQISIPARKTILTGTDLIPNGEFADFSGIITATKNFDTAFTDLVADPDRVVRAHMDYPDARVTLETMLPCGQEGTGVFYYYTADAESYRPGQSYALEPCQFMTDAFNRDLPIALDGGKTRTLRAAVTLMR
ncbi:MAG: hypothetical protein Q4A71_06200 [Actinomycetaceae bacterium]|nr:hypothetical protein [Actinomycetaceae bacterium]